MYRYIQSLDYKWLVKHVGSPWHSYLKPHVHGWNFWPHSDSFQIARETLVQLDCKGLITVAHLCHDSSLPEVLWHFTTLDRICGSFNHHVYPCFIYKKKSKPLSEAESMVAMGIQCNQDPGMFALSGLYWTNVHMCLASMSLSHDAWDLWFSGLAWPRNVRAMNQHAWNTLTKSIRLHWYEPTRTGESHWELIATYCNTLQKVTACCNSSKAPFEMTCQRTTYQARPIRCNLQHCICPIWNSLGCAGRAYTSSNDNSNPTL